MIDLIGRVIYRCATTGREQTGRVHLGVKLHAEQTRCRANLNFKISSTLLPKIVCTRTEVGKLFGRRTALTIQELAEGQCLKSCNVVAQGFENDGAQQKKGYHPLFG